MALDKLVDSAQLDSDLGDVADAIRAKSGGSSQLAFPAGFVSEIGSIQTGGGTRTPVKLGEYTITEPVRTFSITLTQEMRALDRLWVFTTSPITKDQSDYLYISLGSTYTHYFGSSASNNVTGLLCNFPSAQLGQKQYGAISLFSVIGISGYTAKSTEGSLATSIAFYCYSSSKKLTGGTIEVWG